MGNQTISCLYVQGITINHITKLKPLNLIFTDLDKKCIYIHLVIRTKKGVIKVCKD